MTPQTIPPSRYMIRQDVMGGALRYTLWIQDPVEGDNSIYVGEDLYRMVNDRDGAVEDAYRIIYAAYPHLADRKCRRFQGQVYDDSDPGVISFLQEHHDLKRLVEDHWETSSKFVATLILP